MDTETKVLKNMTAGDILLQRDVETVLRHCLELRIILREVEEKKRQLKAILARISHYSCLK